MLHHSSIDAADAVAGDVMTTHVVSVSMEADVQSVARTLFENAVGGAPVVDGAGVPVGMVSDGDLFGRRAAEHRAGPWLELLGGGGSLDDRISVLRSRSVKDVMASPLVSVGPLTRARDVARLLQAKRIKRLPVIDGGRMIGLVGRAELLGLFEHLPRPTAERAASLHGLLQSLSGGGHHDGPSDAGLAGASRGKPAEPPVSADGFRGMVHASKQGKIDEDVAARREGTLEDQHMVKLVLERHLSDQAWQQLVAHAEEAARNGGEEMELLRFPSNVCSDGGRAINIRAENWQRTLQGEAAEVYNRWSHDLKPKGFGLGARVLSFTHGIVGDLGLFLTWGE